jgi:hypothetical protein
MCDASASQTTSALRALESAGLVVREITGRAHIWRMAEGHILAPVLAALFRAESESLTAPKHDLETIIRKPPIARATLFGSVARGGERATSDIDLLALVRSRAVARGTLASRFR